MPPNFVINIDRSGKDHAIRVPTTGKDGWFAMAIEQLHDGELITSAVISGQVADDGRLILSIDGHKDHQPGGGPEDVSTMLVVTRR